MVPFGYKRFVCLAHVFERFRFWLWHSKEVMQIQCWWAWVVISHGIGDRERRSEKGKEDNGNVYMCVRDGERIRGRWQNIQRKKRELYGNKGEDRSVWTGKFDCVFFMLRGVYPIFGRRNNLYSKHYNFAKRTCVIRILVTVDLQQTHHFSLIFIWPI